MQQIDLFSKVGGPAFLGFMLQVTPLELGLIIISLWNLFSLLPEYLLLHNVFETNRDALLAPPASQNDVPSTDPNESNDENDNNNKKKQQQQQSKGWGIKDLVDGFVNPWKRYFQHPILFASLSYVSLYLTILAPGGHLTAFLASEGMEPAVIGSCYAFAAIIGLTGTTSVPFFIRSFGVHKTGFIAIWSQWIILLFASLSFSFYPLYGRFLLLLFVLLISFSRFPLWSFDLAQRQIMQLELGDHERSSITSAETSLTNISTLLVGLLGVIFSDPSEFHVLIFSSLFMVFCASSFFSLWFFSNPSPSSLKKKD